RNLSLKAGSFFTGITMNFCTCPALLPYFSRPCLPQNLLIRSRFKSEESARRVHRKRTEIAQKAH
ncbi:MAG: hypothetical protein WBN16_00875, partial [Lutimonas sp.]